MRPTSLRREFVQWLLPLYPLTGLLLAGSSTEGYRKTIDRFMDGQMEAMAETARAHRCETLPVVPLERDRCTRTATSPCSSGVRPALKRHRSQRPTGRWHPAASRARLATQRRRPDLARLHRRHGLARRATRCRAAEPRLSRGRGRRALFASIPAVSLLLISPPCSAVIGRTSRRLRLAAESLAHQGDTQRDTPAGPLATAAGVAPQVPPNSPRWCAPSRPCSPGCTGP